MDTLGEIIGFEDESNAMLNFKRTIQRNKKVQT